MKSRYVLMLLADPGAPREEVFQAFESAIDIQPDIDRRGCFRLRAGEADVELLVGSKDPVESIHCEFDRRSNSSALEIARRLLGLASGLGMYVEDVQWGRELTEPGLGDWLAHWKPIQTGPESAASPRDRWWRRLPGLTGGE